jgi:hypothetical protein
MNGSRVGEREKNNRRINKSEKRGGRRDFKQKEQKSRTRKKNLRQRRGSL